MKHLTDSELLRQTTKLVQQEKELLTQVLEHLREISDRKLFSELGYKSLFEFAVKHLGYSEDQSYRRIAAMKLVKQVPGLEEKIQNGEVNLSHIGFAQSLFRQEAKLEKPFSLEQKQEVFTKIAGTSAREAVKITLKMSSRPESLRPKKVTPVSDSAFSVQVTINKETLQKIETLKGWLAHRFPEMGTGELIEKLCELGVAEWNPSKVTRKKSAPAPTASREPTAQNQQKGFQFESDPIADFVNYQKGIPASVRRQVFQTAQNQCEKCQSTSFLEIDHRLPKALGGTNKPENLRVLCRNCNQRAAINAFGKEKIVSYFSNTSSF